MAKASWRDTAELVGIIAIVASLVFVGLQLRQEQRIGQSQIGQADEASSTLLDLAIAENADIWLKSNNGEPLTKRDDLIMNRLVGAMYRRARIEAVMRRTLGQSGFSPIVDFAVDLYENPGARAIWEKQAAREALFFGELRPDDTFRQSYQEEVRRELSKLDASGIVRRTKN